MPTAELMTSLASTLSKILCQINVPSLMVSILLLEIFNESNSSLSDSNIFRNREGSS